MWFTWYKSIHYKIMHLVQTDFFCCCPSNYKLNNRIGQARLFELVSRGDEDKK